jgi:hypothetical protein
MPELPIVNADVVDFGPQTPAVRKILAQLRTADTLTFTLSAVPVLAPTAPGRRQAHATLTAWRAARDTGRASAWGAAWAAACSLVGDQPAAVDVAVAEVVQDLISGEVSAALTTPWRAAVAVREELRQLGPTAESLARDLLERGWTNAIQGLPEVARGMLVA